MELQEIKDALALIKTEVKGATKEQKTEMKSAIEALEVKLSDSAKLETKAIKEAFELELKELQKQFDELASKKVEVKTATQDVDFNYEFKSAISDNFEEIKSVRKGNGFKMELKAVGTMTSTSNVTGSTVKTYQNGVSMSPSQKINFSDLVATVASATGNYIVYREVGQEGGIISQTEGASKSQIDYDFEEITYNAKYLAGYAVVAKQMM